MNDLKKEIENMANKILIRVKTKINKNHQYDAFNESLENKIKAVAVKKLEECTELHIELISGNKIEANKKATLIINWLYNSYSYGEDILYGDKAWVSTLNYK